MLRRRYNISPSLKSMAALASYLLKHFFRASDFHPPSLRPFRRSYCSTNYENIEINKTNGIMKTKAIKKTKEIKKIIAHFARPRIGASCSILSRSSASHLTSSAANCAAFCSASD